MYNRAFARAISFIKITITTIMASSLEQVRHSFAHLLAAAVESIYPDSKNTIGPAVENGFYYDFEFSSPVSEKEFGKIEQKMREILKSWEKFEGSEVTADEARVKFVNNPYKLELINDIAAKGEKITLYTSGKFVDLCRGGHVESARDMKQDAFKLERVAGAYWRGDEKNKMLTRIYGFAFNSKEELTAFLTMQEEAKKRDHKKLGKELKLFSFSQLVGSGLPLLQPKGAMLKRVLEDYLWDLHKNKGYNRVWTPHLAKEDLYVTSGHAGHYMEDMFSVFGGTSKEKFFLKPMNCPHHMQIFADNQWSYKDLPVRYFEPATVYRDEKTGQLSGLTRVRSITQDDGHLFCRVSQIGQEVSTIVDIIKEFYTTMGMLEGYWVRLSVRGADKSKYLGSDEVWNSAEGSLEQAAKDNKLNYKRGEGEAAFYGPKLDFMFKDAIGREWQLATIQCDFNLPERFDLSFINEKGEKERPVVIHRAISGSLERFMGVAIEHFAGNFPAWLSPVQVKVIPVGEKHEDKAREAVTAFRNLNVRAELGGGTDGFGKRIREAKTERIPYFIIIGDKDLEAGKVTLESRDRGQVGQMTLDEAVKLITDVIHSKA